MDPVLFVLLGAAAVAAGLVLHKRPDLLTRVLGHKSQAPAAARD